MPSEWKSFPCPGSSPRWRHLDEGRIEIEGQGTPTRGWPSLVDTWKAPITIAAMKYGLHPAWVAAIMATESGGRTGFCARLPDGSCAQNEGAGLMAVLPATATSMAGRPVTSEELLHDHDLSIDLGAKYLKTQLDRYGDFVLAALAYNAGSVRCGTGTVWRPAGSDLPKVPCPPTTWGVIMGCVEFPAGSGKISVNQYPRRAIEWTNAAIDKGYVPLGTMAKQAAPFAVASLAALSMGAIGIGVGWWIVTRWKKN